MAVIYQVFDAVDPPATDSYWPTEQAALLAAGSMVDPRIAKHQVGPNKHDLIRALRLIPRRTE
ncbi:hypothetical protein [uncultured Rhodospira sp.]|uniref:hypothetical protein n=1 Tax=uncultured Rhodospira sp. TaxID=1936189 RepID=UPI00262A3DB7|nr:hypothetical protein [uncultured Rhodospira sp.]